MGLAGFTKARAELGWDRIAPRFEQLYELTVGALQPG
jgi:hypothetical protein